MKLYVKKQRNMSLYYITNGFYYTDIGVAEELQINFSFYKDILLSFNAVITVANDFYFESSQDAKRCIEYITNNLDSLVVVSALTE